jgi:hypothetical protein
VQRRRRYGDSASCCRHSSYDTLLSAVRSGAMDKTSHSSIYVAPLQIAKDASRATSRASDRPQTSFSTHGSAYTPSQTGQMTPPLTPSEASFEPPADFQTYLRASHPYHPNYDDNTSTITLPLNIGDIILVHSVHTNGWADGTLLTSGARGWLPTNYCEGYENERIRSLMKALTIFWDLVKGSSVGGLRVFRHADYVRGLIAGVRCLLVRLSSSWLWRGARMVISSTNRFIGQDQLPQQGFESSPVPRGVAQVSESPTFGPHIFCPNCQRFGKPSG